MFGFSGIAAAALGALADATDIIFVLNAARFAIAGDIYRPVTQGRIRKTLTLSPTF